VVVVDYSLAMGAFIATVESAADDDTVNRSDDEDGDAPAAKTPREEAKRISSYYIIISGVDIRFPQPRG
jgi:hypothetical protein